MRLPDWRERFYSGLLDWQRCEFRWGVTDCAQFLRADALWLTGKDFGAQFGEYSTEFGAQRIIAAHGGMEGLLRSAFGEPQPAAMAIDGSPMLCEMGAGLTACVCVGARCVAPSVSGGLDSRLITQALMSWSL